MTQQLDMIESNSPAAAEEQRPLDGSSDNSPQRELLLELKPATVARILTLVVMLLVIVGTIANYLIYNVAPDPEHPLARVLRRFDLGHEPSIPALYSSLALMVSAVLLAVIAISVRRSAREFFYHWLGLSVVFAILAVDETVMVHEMVDTALHQAFGLGGPLFFAWVIPGALFAIGFAIVYIKFLVHLDRLTRWRFIAAGGLFVAGAVGMEMVAGMIADSDLGLESPAHTISQAIEECCEMLGIVLFIYALLDYINMHVGTIRISVSGSKTIEV